MARKKKSFRLMFRFWLDVTKPLENKIAEEIEELKEGRLFSQTIRDGIRLMSTLRKGDLSVLLELFPEVETSLNHRATQRQLTAIELLIKDVQKEAQQPKQMIATLQPLNTITSPNFDDDDDVELEVKKAEGGGGKATQNFLNSLMALQK